MSSSMCWRHASTPALGGSSHSQLSYPEPSRNFFFGSAPCGPTGIAASAWKKSSGPDRTACVCCTSFRTSSDRRL